MALVGLRHHNTFDRKVAENIYIGDEVNRANIINSVSMYFYSNRGVSILIFIVDKVGFASEDRRPDGRLK